jgi:protoporphyrinogen oxidase
MVDFDLSILGSGWAGLLFARKALNLGVNKISLIEESKAGEQGGLLKTEIIDGFTFDCGGPHLLFSRDQQVLSDITDILKTNCSQRERNNFVFYKNQYIQYPFENGIYQLTPHERVRFIKGIIERMLYVSKNSQWKPANFLDWITGFFGDYMASEYLIPYNKKIWKRPLDKMAADWVFTPGRLPIPQLENMLLTVAGISNIGYKEQAYFYYPNNGGISALFHSLYDIVHDRGVKFISGEKVVSIRKDHGKIFRINEKISARRVVSTIPLPDLLFSLDDKNYKHLAEKFDYNSVAVVGVAIKGKTPNQTSIYVPDSRIIFHRYTWMSSLIPPKDQDKSNLIAEVTIPKGEDFDLDKITKNVIKGLLDIGVIEDENSVLFTKVWFNKYGYPIYSLDHNEIREEAMRILDSYRIITVGRWGSWHYWNTDMVYKAVNEINFKAGDINE